MAIFNKTTKEHIQDLRPLSIPHRDRPEEEVLEDAEILEEVDPQRPGVVVPQSPLIVEFFLSENETVTNGEIDVTAIAVDPDGDNSLLTFDFTSEAGTFSDQTLDINDTGQAVSVVTWTAPATIPEDPIEYLIDVVVTDEDELTAHTGDDVDAQRPSLSVIVRFHCQRPDRPDAPTVMALSSITLNVRWIAPNNNGCDIEDYDLRYRVRAEPDETQNDWTDYKTDDDAWLPATELSDIYEEAFTVTADLLRSLEYQVRATNLAGTSDWSPSGYLEHTPPPVSIEADPDVIALSESATIPNQSTITVTATDTIDDVSDLTYTFTVYQINDDNTETNIGVMDLSGTGTSRTFSHPGTNADYQIQVIVTNLGNISTTERVLVRAIDIPDQPEIPSVTLIDTSSVEVRWIEPENNRSEISDYDLRYKLVSEVSENYLEWMSEQAFLDLVATITGLGTDAANYHVQVRAENEAGESLWSEPASANGPPIIDSFTGQILDDPDATPTSDPISINIDQRVQLVLTAHDTDNPPDTLSYSFDVTHIDGVDIADNAEVNIGSFTDTELLNQPIYVPSSASRDVTFTIQATVSDGLPEDGGFSVSETLDITVANRLPEIVRIEVVDDELHIGAGTDIDATVVELDGDTLTYLWTIVDIDDSTNTAFGSFANATVLKARYTSSMVVGTYRITLTVTEVETSATVSESVDIDVIIEFTVPGIVRLLDVEPTIGSHTALDAEWSEPEDDGGTPITEYEIQHRLESMLSWDDTTNTSQTLAVDDSTSYPITETISSLLENTEYDVRVRARNMIGYGDWSNTVTERTTTTLTVTLQADDTTPNKGDTVNFEARPNLDDVTYSPWVMSPDLGEMPVSDSPNIQDWVAPYLSSLYQSEVNSDTEAYTMTVSVSHAATSQTVTVSQKVEVVNRAPAIIGLTATGLTISTDNIPRVAPGERVPFTVTAVDADTVSATVGDSISTTWTHIGGSGSAPDATYMGEGLYGSTFQWTLPNESGLYTLEVIATDNDYVTDDDDNVVLASDSRTAQVQVNDPPVINITGPTDPVDAGTIHTLSITITDTDNDIDSMNIRLITHEGGGTYIGSVATVSDGNYTQQWQAPNMKGRAVVEVEYVEYYESTPLSTVRAQTSIEINNQAPEVRIIPETAIITTVQELELTAVALSGNLYIDPDGDDVTFSWEIVSGPGKLSPNVSPRQPTDDAVITNPIFYIPSSPPDAPDAPTVESDPDDSMVLDLSWVAPNDNGADITDYDLRYKRSSEDETHWIDIDFTGTETTHSVDSLDSNESYDFQVRAQNFTGESDWSPTGTGETSADVPDTPVPPTITVPEGEIRQLRADWIAPDDNGEAITDYNVQYRIIDDAGIENTYEGWPDPDTTSTDIFATITGLDESTTYEIRVQAVNSKGNSEWSDPGVGVTGTNQAPEVRIIPETAIITETQELELTAVPEEGNEDIDPDGGDVTFSWEIVSGPGKLSPDVSPREPTDDAVTTNPIFYIPSSPPDAPDAPTVESDPDDGMVLNLSWVAPNDNGSDITDYDLRYKKSSEDETHWLGIDFDGTETTHSIDGLDSSESYDFQVRAQNFTGESDWSPTGTGSTINDPPTIDSFTADDDVLNISGMTSIYVVASDTDDDELHYEFEIVDDPGDNTYGFLTPHATDDSQQTYTAPGETGDFEIQVQVFDVPEADRDSNVNYPTESITIMVTSIPGQPGAPTVTAGSNDLTMDIPRSSLDVSWTDPDDNDITSYDVQYKESVESIYISLTLADDFTDTMVTIHELKPNTTYNVQFRAVNEIGAGEWSITGTGTTAADVPNTPETPTITVPEGETRQLRADWIAPDNNGEAITDYNVQYRILVPPGEPENTYDGWPDPDTTSTDLFTIIGDIDETYTGLDESTTYEIRVQAVNSEGNSGWSDPGVGTTGSTNTAPVIVSFTSDADDNLVSAIAHPTLPESVTITVIATDAQTASNLLTYTFTLVGTSLEELGGFLGNLLDTTERHEKIFEPPPNIARVYHIDVTVSDGDTQLEQPTERISITAALPPDRPNAPTVTQDPNNSFQLTVTWDEPDFNLAPITDYDIRYRKSSEISYQEWRPSETILSRIEVISGLDGNEEYQVQVRAKNVVGESNWSDTGTESTRNTAPNITAFISSPELVAVFGESTLIVTATDLEGDDLTYTFNLPDETEVDDHGSLLAITGETSRYKYTAPSTVGTYTVRVTVSDGSLSSRKDISIVVTDGIPPAPNAPTVETHTAGSIRVRWDAPVTFQGPPVTHYHLRYKLESVTSYTIYVDSDMIPININSRFEDIDGLSHGTTYDVQVRAVNAAGASDWSDDGTGVTGVQPPVLPPNAPVISSITSPAHDTLSVTWVKPPIDDDPTTDDDITSYDVQYKKADASDYIDLTLADDFTGLTVDITGLDGNTLYDVRVQASNSAGASGYSDPPTQFRTQVQIMVPDPPESLMLSQNPDPTKLGVTWQVPNLFGGTLVDYDVQYRETVEEGETENAWLNWPLTDTISTRPSETIENLTAETEYEVRARTQNDSTLDAGDGVGTSAWSDSVTGSTAEVVTVARVPDAPVITSPVSDDPNVDPISGSPIEIFVGWSEPNDNDSTITGYYVEYKTVASNSWLLLDRVASKLLLRTAVISNLIPNTRYNVRVYARNSVGDSPYSQVATVRTAQIIRPPAPNVTVDSVTTNSVTISWTAPGTTYTILSYRIEIKLFSEGVSSYRQWTRRMTGRIETISNLSDGTRYNIRVAAVIVGNVVGEWGTVSPTTVDVNEAPQILEFFANPTQITTNQVSTLTVNAIDPDPNDPLFYHLPTVTLFNGESLDSMLSYGSFDRLTADSQGRRRFRFTPPDRDNVTGVYTIEAVVEDSELEDSDTVDITVIQVPNNPPVVSLSGPTESIENTDVIITATIRDPDEGDTWTGTWSDSPVETIGSFSQLTDSGDQDDNTAVITYTMPLLVNASKVTVTFEAIDNHGESDSDTLDIDVRPTPTVPHRVTGVMASPVSGSHTSLSVSWDTPPTFSNGGDTVDKYEVIYRAGRIQGESIAFFAAETIEVLGEQTSSTTLTELSEGTPYRVEVRAHNSVGWGLKSRAVVVFTTSPNEAPTVEIQIGESSESSFTVEQLATVRIDAIATDNEDSVSDLTFSWSRSPNVGTFIDFEDDRNYQVWRAPGTSTACTVTVTVEDTGGKTATDSIILNVPNDAPSIDSFTEGRKVCPGSIISIDVSATDDNAGDTLTYDWTYPGDGTLQQNNTRLRWTAPSSPGTYSVTVTVSDPEGESVSRTSTFTVNTTPTVSMSASKTTVAASEQITITAIVTDIDDDYGDLIDLQDNGGGTWVGSISTTSLGGGQTEVTRDWRAPSSKGDYTISYTFSDSCGSGSGSVTVTVGNSPPDPEINPPLASTILNRPVTFECNPDDPDGNSDIDTYSWSISGTNSGSFNDNSAKIVVYTPGTATGTFTITCVVTDLEGATGTATATVIVTRPLNPPTVSLSAADTTLDPDQFTNITATTTNFNSNTDNHDITWSVSPTGGTFTRISDLRYRFTAPSIEAGTEYVVTAEVSTPDDDASDSVTLTVNNIAPVITSFSGVPETVIAGGSFPVTVNATDNNSGILSYSWSPTSLFSDRFSQTATFEAPSRTGPSNARRTFTCTVSDNPHLPYTSLSDSHSETVIVIPDNPDPPVGFSFDTSDHNSMSFTWSAPLYDGGTAIAGYYAELLLNGSVIRTMSLGSSARRVTWSNLSQNTTYQCRVRCNNEFTFSGTTYGGDSSFTTASGSTTMPVLSVFVSASEEDINPGGESTITAVITSVSGSPSVTWTRMPTAGTLIGSSNTSRTFRAPMNVVVGTSYTITVTVREGPNTVSDSVTIYILNVAPTVEITGVPATVRVGGDFTMTASTDDDNGDDIDTYLWSVDIGELDSETIRRPEYTAPSRTGEIDGEVYIQVTVTDDPPVGSSESGFDDDTVIVVPNNPSSVRNLALDAMEVDENTLRFTWDAPTSDGGAPITGYDVELRLGSTVVESDTVSSESVTWFDLDGGATYQCRVRSSNQFEIRGTTYGGTSSFSSRNGTTDETESTVFLSVIDDELAPGGEITITADIDNLGSGRVSWTRTGGTLIGSSNTSRVFRAPTNVVAGTEYTIRVTVTKTGYDPVFDEVTITILNVAPTVTITGVPPTVRVGGDFTMTAVTDDDNGDDIDTYLWSVDIGTLSGGSSEDDTQTSIIRRPEYTAPDRTGEIDGEVYIEVEVTDDPPVGSSESGFDDDTVIVVPNNPSSVRNLALDDDFTDEDSLRFTWDAPTSDGGAPITGYEVELRLSGSLVESDTVFSESVTWFGLDSGTTYQCRVRSSNQFEIGGTTYGGTSSFSSRNGTTDEAESTVFLSASDDELAPGGETTITADIEDLGSGTVSWTRMPTAGTLTGSSNTSRVFTAPTNVVAGTEYTIRVTVTKTGYDPVFDEVTITILNVAPTVTITGVPPTVRVGGDFTMTAVTDDDNGDDIDTYLWSVDIGTLSGGSSEDDTQTSIIRRPEYTAPDRTGEIDGEVYIEVEVTDDPPVGSSESGFDDDTVIVVPNNPSSVRNLALDDDFTDEDSLRFTWDAPTSDGGAPITGYEVELRLGNTVVESDTVSSESVTWFGLDSGTTYQCRVRSSNEFDIGGTTYGGTSSYSSRNGTTDEAESTVFVYVEDAVDELDPGGEVTIIAEIENLGSGRVTWTRTPTAGTLIGSSNTSRRYRAPTNVEAGTEYTIRVTVTKTGYDPVFDEVTITILNVAPTVTITGVPPTVRVGGDFTMTAVTDDDNGDDIDTYLWSVDIGTLSGGSSEDDTQTSIIRRPEYTAPDRTGDIDGEEYIQVEVTDDPPAGYSIMTGFDDDTVIVVPNNPGSVRNLALDTMDVFEDSLRFTWDAPTSDGGAPITGYEVELRLGNTVVESDTVSSESVTWFGLDSGTTYQCRVRSSNEFDIGGTTYGGTSSYSSRNGTTDETESTVFVYIEDAVDELVPGGEANIIAEIENLGSGRVSWTRTGGTLIGSSNTSRRYRAPTNVEAGTEYTIRVTVTKTGYDPVFDEVTITINNVAPTVTITGVPATVRIGRSFRMTASTLEPNGDDIDSYLWSVQVGTLSGGDDTQTSIIRRPSYTAPSRTGEIDGEEYIQVKVTDDPPAGYSSLDGFDDDTVIVVPNNPSSVRNLALDTMDVFEDSLRFTWDAPTSDGGAPITGYDVELRLGSTVVQSDTINSESVIWFGLDSGTTYQCRVRSSNKFEIGGMTYGGNSGFSSRNGTTDETESTVFVYIEDAVDELVPGGEANIIAEIENLGSGRVSWTRTGGTLIGSSNTSRTYRAPTNVVAGTEYTIRVTVTKTGYDPVFDEVTITILNVAPTVTITGVPPTVRVGRNFIMTAVTDDDNGDDIDTYLWSVDIGTLSGGSSDDDTQTSIIRRPRYTAPDRTGEIDAEVYIDVTVTDDPPVGSGESGFDDDTVIVVPNNPGSVRNLALDTMDVFEDSLRFTWDAPTSDGGAPLTGHYAELLLGGSVVRDVSGSGNARSVIWRGLDGGVTYQCRVRCSNEFEIGGTTYGGNSRFVTRSGTTSEAQPSISVFAIDEEVEPGGEITIQADIENLGNGRVSWTRTGGSLIGSSNTSRRFRAPFRVEEGTEYTITVTITKTGFDTVSDSITITILNVAPIVNIIGVPATVRVGRSFIMIAVGEDDNGDSLTYQWYVDIGTLSGGDDSQTSTLGSPNYTAPSRTSEIDGEVYIEVEATDGSLSDDDNDTVIVVPNNPGSVRNLILSDRSDTELVFTWDEPTSDGGAPITGYEVELRLSGSLVDSDIISSESITWFGLTPNTLYQCRVRASNEFDIGGTTYGGTSSVSSRNGRTLTM